MRQFAPAVIWLVFFFLSNGVAQTKCGAIGNGAFVSGKTYHNERLSFDYPIPNGFIATDLSTLPKSDHDANLLILWKSKRQQTGRPNLTIQTDDPSRYDDQSAVAYMHRIQFSVTGWQSAKVSETGKVYKFLGGWFYRLDYLLPDSLSPVFNIALTGRVGQCELTFLVSADSAEEAETLFRSLIAIKTRNK